MSKIYLADNSVDSGAPTELGPGIAIFFARMAHFSESFILSSANRARRSGLSAFVVPAIALGLLGACAAPKSVLAGNETPADASHRTIGRTPASAAGSTPSSVASSALNSKARAALGATSATAETADPLKQYSFIDPQHLIDRGLLRTTMAYFIKNKSEFANQNYVAVIDYAKPSNQNRLFIVNLKTGAVWGLPVAHGKGSDPKHSGIAKLFSDLFGSNSTSLGFYRTADTYVGENGLSLQLDGLSPTNTHARERKIVIHGADYVQEGRAIQGRSWGCPAVPMKARDNVIAFLKNGSLLYAGLSSPPTKQSSIANQKPNPVAGAAAKPTQPQQTN